MKLGIIAAIQTEAELIIDAMTDKSVEACGGIKFHLGKIGNTDMIVAVCGVGKVFAAMCAQTMIIKYSPDAIINTGVGGTLTKKLTIGNVAVADALVQHDMDTSPTGDPLGMISGINIVEIPADRTLSDKLVSILSDMGIPSYRGVIATGDQFIASREKKEYIVNTFNGISCEMEGGAVAQVCYCNNVPFTVIRAISDDADNHACEDFPSFIKSSAKNSANAVIRLAGSY